MVKILRKSHKIAEMIRKIFSDESDERIIAVAYVGANAISYLPNPRNIKIYCSTAIPGTNPISLRELKKNGVDIRKIDKLHSKLYWSKSHGVVICSANLSDNGLSKKGNHEAGVYLPPDSFDVDNYVNSFRSDPINFSDINALEREYNLYMLRNRTTQGVCKPPDFLDWNEETGPAWKIFLWTEEADLPKDVSVQLAREHPEVEEENTNYIVSAASDSYQEGGWVLEFKARYNDGRLQSVRKFDWFIPEVRIMSQQPYDDDYPHYWINLHNTTLPSQPFVINRKFINSFKKTFVEMINDCETVTTPSSEFIKRLCENYKAR